MPAPTSNPTIPPDDVAGARSRRHLGTVTAGRAAGRAAVGGLLAVVAAALAGRGILGLAGRTDLVSPVSTGQEFRRLDRRLYAPICLGLAALAALSLRAEPPREQPTVAGRSGG